MSNIIKGTKLHMTQIFADTGAVVPVTVISTSDQLSSDLINKGIVIVGTSKGKGFAGVMKKWNFSGVGESTRGQSNKQRSGGSIGAQTPGRVLRGKKMAGRMGGAKITIKSSRIVSVDENAKTLMVSGPVPGARNGEVTIKIS
jgi:large subunit ribosomal protein L3